MYTQFVLDGGDVTEELQGSTYTNKYSQDAESLGGTVYWMLKDGQPSTRQLINSSQSITNNYITDSFGNSVSSSGSAFSPFQWNAGGKYYCDDESGLQKVGARYYEPATGRWISQDTILVAGSAFNSQTPDRYLYCGADPANNADPSGRNPFVIGAIILLLIVIAVNNSGCIDAPVHDEAVKKAQETAKKAKERDQYLGQHGDLGAGTKAGDSRWLQKRNLADP